MPRLRFAPSACPDTAADRLDRIIVPQLNPERFDAAIRRLRRRFAVYAETCPVPLPASGLIVTSEIRRQCEVYLPIDEISNAFNQLYRAALTHPPLLTSTPFDTTLSWADAHSRFPRRLRCSADPSRLLEALLDDRDLLVRFLLASFLPERFYGGFRRYPEQLGWARNWMTSRARAHCRCLDAACGTGEGTWDLAGLLRECGWAPDACSVEGWTIEPLEVWVAAHGSFPHDHSREEHYRQETGDLLASGWGDAILFACVDTASPLPRTCRLDLITCNGLLGGPILHQPAALRAVVGNLSGLLAAGGVLLAADRFHEGWKRKCPQDELRALFEACGLETFRAGEGIGGLKLHQ